MKFVNLPPFGRRLVGAIQHVLAREYDDEFVMRLRQLNTGLVKKGNVRAFREAIGMMPAGDIVEIGTFTGFSTNILSYFCHKLEKKNSRIFSCDRWNYDFKGLGDERKINNTDLRYSEWSKFAKDTAVRNVSFFRATRPCI